MKTSGRLTACTSIPTTSPRKSSATGTRPRPCSRLPRKLEFLRKAKDAGFFIRLFYVCTSDPTINVARIDADKRQIENDVAGVKLFSVNNVTNTEVELTAELSVIAAEMPYFIYNDNDTVVEVSIVFDGETTSISTVKTDADKMDGEWYDLSGRRVAQPAKGIYVKNGRKVIVRSATK